MNNPVTQRIGGILPSQRSQQVEATICPTFPKNKVGGESFRCLGTVNDIYRFTDLGVSTDTLQRTRRKPLDKHSFLRKIDLSTTQLNALSKYAPWITVDADTGGAITSEEARFFRARFMGHLVYGCEYDQVYIFSRSKLHTLFNILNLYRRNYEIK